ncbi:phosphate ABC transporter permease subunit PstC, partial [Rhodococcus sp. NPDC058514]
MSDAPTQSAPRTPTPGDVGTGVGGPLGTPEAPITPTPAASSKTVTRPGDRVFTSMATGSAVFITVLIAAIGAFLVWRAVPALARNEVNFLTSSKWDTQDINEMAFGVLDLFQVTVLVSVFALLLAMPVALGIAIF